MAWPRMPVYFPRGLLLLQIASLGQLLQKIRLEISHKILYLTQPLLECIERNVATDLRKTWVETREGGLLTSAKTFSRRSSGATRKRGMFRFGCIAIRSAILKRPE